MNEKEPYKLPFISYFKLRTKELVGFVFISILFWTIALTMLKDDLLIMSIISFLFGALFLYSIVAMALKMNYLKVTDKYIQISMTFNKRKVDFRDVVYIDIVSRQGNDSIRIVTKKYVRRQQSFLSRSIDLLFSAPYGLMIPLMFMSDIDIERLMITLKSKINQKEIERFLKAEGLIDNKKESREEDNKKEKIQEESFLKAMISCCFISVFIGLIYGYVLSLFKENFNFFIMLIPVTASFLIIHIYHKVYKETEFNIYYRIVIGFISIIPIASGLISKVYFKLSMTPTLENLITVVRNEWIFIINDPYEYIFFLIIAVYVFINSTLQGRKTRIQNKISKVSTSKYGEYYCKKKKNIFKIYIGDNIVDPEDFGWYKGIFIVEINEGCLIEKNNKRIVGFYIPKEHIEETSIIFPKENYISINDKTYYYIDLCGSSKEGIQLYYLSCILYCNENNEVQVIEIEHFDN